MGKYESRNHPGMQGGNFKIGIRMCLEKNNFESLQIRFHGQYYWRFGTILQEPCQNSKLTQTTNTYLTTCPLSEQNCALHRNDIVEQCKLLLNKIDILLLILSLNCVCKLLVLEPWAEIFGTHSSSL